MSNKSEDVPLEDMNNKTDESTPLKGDGGSAAAAPTTESINNVTASAEQNIEEKLKLEKDAETGNNKGENAELKGTELRELLIGEGGCKWENPKFRRFLLWLLVAFVALLVFIILFVLLYSDDDDTYRYIRIVPRPRGKNNLIYFRHGELSSSTKGSYLAIADEIETFLGPYRRPPEEAVLCPKVNRTENEVCFFDYNGIARECLNPPFGYQHGTPCIYVVFNNIPDFIPYNNGTMARIECRANTASDEENAGPLNITPQNGFSIRFFPYKGHKSYMAPFVALRLSSPAQNVAIGITCSLMDMNFPPGEVPTDEPLAYIPFNVYIE